MGSGGGPVFGDAFRADLYYALRLADGKILRVARTAESAVLTLLSSFTLLGGLVIVILVLEFFLVQKQTRDLIAPINELELENPLKECAMKSCVLFSSRGPAE